MKIVLFLCFLASDLLQGNDAAPAPEDGYRSMVFDERAPFNKQIVGSNDGNFGGNGGQKYLLVEINPE